MIVITYPPFHHISLQCFSPTLPPAFSSLLFSFLLFYLHTPSLTANGESLSEGREAPRRTWEQPCALGEIPEWKGRITVGISNLFSNWEEVQWDATIEEVMSIRAEKLTVPSNHICESKLSKFKWLFVCTCFSYEFDEYEIIELSWQIPFLRPNRITGMFFMNDFFPCNSSSDCQIPYP